MNTLQQPTRHGLKRALQSFGRRKATLLDLHTGQQLHCPADMEWSFRDGRYYEANVEHWLTAVILRQSEPIFYDIGANLGYYSLVIGRHARRFYCFEPSTSTRNTLLGNLERNALTGSAEVFGVALSDHVGAAELHLYNSSGNNSLFARDVPAGHTLTLEATERVPLTTLDDFIRDRRPAPPTLMKIDVEGGELAVLRGAVDTIRAHRPSVLFEFSPATARDAGYEPHALLDVLRPFGYRFLGLPSDPDDMSLVEMTDSTPSSIDNVLAVPAEQVSRLAIRDE